MKTLRKNRSKTLLLIALSLTLLPFSSYAQVYSVLKSFPPLPSSYSTNVGGAQPWAGVTLFDGVLYGTTTLGGLSSGGTIFKLNTDGTGFTVLKNFNGDYGADNDGFSPRAGLLLSDNIIYGTTFAGGTNIGGTVFRIKTDGTEFNIIKQSILADSYGFSCGLELVGSTLYGVSINGGIFTNGSIFKMQTNGSDYSVIKSFRATATNGFGTYTNTDGQGPESELTIRDGILFGSTPFGGVEGHGILFRVETNGNNFTVLKIFPSWSSIPPRTNSEGAKPVGKMVIIGNHLFGTTQLGGEYGRGVIFSLETNGNNFTVLKHFSVSDGSAPFAGLTFYGNTFYGTTRSGGVATNGVIFKLHTDGSGYSVLKHFSPNIGSTNADGKGPWGTLAFSGGILYGTTESGGSAANGTIFSFDLRPPLGLSKVGSQLVLNWTNNNFSLQSASSVSGVFTNIVGATSPFTNTASDTQQFFRLNSN